MAESTRTADGEVLFETGDSLSETHLAQRGARANATDYVERGTGLSADYGASTVDIGNTDTRGNYAILRSDGLAYHLYPDQVTDVPLPEDAGENYVFIAYDESSDEMYYHADDDDTAPTDPSIKIGEIDTAAGSTTELNRNPDGSFTDVVVDSLQADSLSNADGEPDQRFNRIGREEPSEDTGTVQFSGLSNDTEYRLFYSTAVDTAGSDVFVRINGDGAATGNYSYWNESGTHQTGENEFLVATLTNNTRLAGDITVANARFGQVDRTGLNHRFLPAGPPDRISTFGREGSRNVSSGISSIEFVAADDFSGGETVVELWERDYS